MDESTPDNINVFHSLFKGREDVFAVRWEKGNKSGYMPAYFYDPYRFRSHKSNGGTFQDFTEKSYLRLTDEQIQKHLDTLYFAQAKSYRKNFQRAFTFASRGKNIFKIDLHHRYYITQKRRFWACIFNSLNFHFPK